jgi:2-keto-4-pentenoate hydratase/2-oxohepta-3-ene-1,7-dioic acid hydratase in catechol pathway
VAGVGNIFAIGLNYGAHVSEIGEAHPPEPIVFTKATSSITGPHDPLVLPPGSQSSDWEVELGVVIGSPAFNVSEAEAPRCIAGYLVVNDVSERDFQMNRGGQWVKGKSAPTFAPLGPYFVTADGINDPQALELWLDLNGERVQSATTAEMIVPCTKLVSYLSEFLRLLPGDIISTGTPSGIGAMMDPPRFLRPGDVVEAGVEGLGVQRNVVAAPG